MPLSFAKKKVAQRKGGFHRGFDPASLLDASFFGVKERDIKPLLQKQTLCC
jgi:hypothetical protein